jgi:hypothetical protein
MSITPNTLETSQEKTDRILDETLNWIDQNDAFSDYQKTLMRHTLIENKAIFSEDPGLASDYVCHLNVKPHTVYHRKSYPIPFSKREAARKEINHMLELGVIEPSNAEYSSPLVCVSKKDGGVRLCLDARNLNEILVDDRESPPPIDEILHKFHGQKIFSTTDFTSGYWQIAVAEESRDYLSFLFDGQNYRFTRMAFGVKHAMASFIKCVKGIIGDEILDFCTIYVDDGIIASNSIEEHCQHLDRLFKKLSKSNLKIKLSKCNFFQPQVKFLGHVISHDGIEQDPEKVEAIRNFPAPRNRKQLQKFLGFLQFYRKFSDHLSEHTAGLKHVLSTNKTWKWGELEQQAFEKIKQSFLGKVVLKHPDLNAPFYINSDASHCALGGEIYQIDPEGEKGVIAFFSKSLNDAETRYTTTEKELYSILSICLKYRTLILGRKIYVNTDHIALTFIKTAKLTNNRISRWFIALQEFDLEVIHIPGKNNKTADYLSREIEYSYESANIFKCYPVIGRNAVASRAGIQPITVINRVTPQSVLQGQKDDPKLKKMREILQDFTHPDRDKLSLYRIHQNLIFHRTRKESFTWKLIIPAAMVDDLVWEAHERYGHFGATKIFHVLNQVCHFKNMRRQIAKLISTCEICQKTKYDRFTPGGHMIPIIPNKPLEVVSVDVYGPLPRSSHRHKFILVVLDIFSKYCKLYPVAQLNAAALAQFITGDFRSKVGTPEKVLSDNASYFNSSQWKEVLALNGNIEAIYTTTYHPEGNPVERVMAEIGRFMRAYCYRSHKDWSNKLTFLEDCLNCTFHTSTGFTAYEILHGKRNQTFLEKIIDFPMGVQPKTNYVLLAKKNLEKMAEKRKKYHDVKKKWFDFKVGDLVLLRSYKMSKAVDGITKKFFHLYSGPYSIKEVHDNNTVSIQDGTSGEDMGRHNRTQIKPYKRL